MEGNPIIDLLMSHRSIRKFAATPVTREQVNAIVRAGQAASTSSNMQAYSVIAVEDPDKRKRLAELAGGQQYVESCGAFLVWCGDLNRLQHICSKQGKEVARTTENLLIATIDAALAAQNAVIAAESMGLGIVYIGGIRNNIAAVSELLALPELVYPVFGMCIGYPYQQPEIRPRLPLEAVLHTDAYDAGKHEACIAEYDKAYIDYMRSRTGGGRIAAWSEDMAERASRLLRLHMKPFLEEKGFARQ